MSVYRRQQYKRELFTTDRVRQMQQDAQKYELELKQTRKELARDKLTAFDVAAQERAERKRYILLTFEPQWPYML